MEKLLATVLVALGLVLVAVELMRRLYGAVRFLELDEAELLNISKVLVTTLAVLLLPYLLMLTVFK